MPSRENAMPRQNRKASASRKPSFPNRASDDKAVEDAAQVLRARYHGDVRSMAAEILREAAEDYESYEDAEEWIQQQVHETVDGSAMIIYTQQAINVLIQSDNWDQIDEVGADVPDGMSNIVTVAAYYALRADVEEDIMAMKDEYFPEDDD
jgi:hypothetical protein